MTRGASSLEDYSLKSPNPSPVSCFPRTATVISACEAGSFLKGFGFSPAPGSGRGNDKTHMKEGQRENNHDTIHSVSSALLPKPFYLLLRNHWVKSSGICSWLRNNFQKPLKCQGQHETMATHWIWFSVKASIHLLLMHIFYFNLNKQVEKQNASKCYGQKLHCRDEKFPQKKKTLDPCRALMRLTFLQLLLDKSNDIIFPSLVCSSEVLHVPSSSAVV